MAVAKRKLLAPNEPILRKTPAETALSEKKLELETLRDRHRLAVVAQRENELSAAALSKRDPGLVVEKRKLEDRPRDRRDGTAGLVGSL